MSYFRNDAADIWYKSGNSPVSQADCEIDHFLKNHLTGQKPDHAWLSEETEDNPDRLQADRIFVVDPIDGTRGFINGRKEWCVSIAIVEAGRPIEGVLHCPAMGVTAYAKRGLGLFLAGKSAVATKPERDYPLVTGSKKVIEAIRGLPENLMETTDFIPSLAYRLSLVATGELDGAFARPGASEWDIAAADIILEEAGCSLSDRNGNPIHYNKTKVSSPSLVAASAERREEILTLANSSGILQ